jgi:hypothetical protein
MRALYGKAGLMSEIEFPAEGTVEYDLMQKTEEIYRLKARITILENKLEQERTWGKLNAWESIRAGKTLQRLDDQITKYMLSDALLVEPMTNLRNLMFGHEPVGGIE